MHKIKILNKISSEGLKTFSSKLYNISDDETSPDAILLRSFKMHEMELPASLKVVGRAGAGVNNIPIEKCTEKGIVVLNTPGANANAVKELTILALLLSSRRVIEGINFVGGLKNATDISKNIEKNKSTFTGPEILGKKLGVIGLGQIGVMVSNSATSLGMDVSGFDPFISVDSAWNLSREVKKAASLDELIKTSDYITLHIPETEKTKGFMNENRISMMKKGARLINLSRGGVVDEKALLKALEADHISTYVTDFASADFISAKNTICFPHLGASTPEAEENCAMMIASQVANFLENGNISNSVNLPNCQLGRQTDTRLTIINKNVPNMVGQFTAVLAASKLNIQEMLNKSKSETAYNIIDIDGPIDDSTISRIEAIEGVIKTRVI
ncbi:MAG: 3-phosphoglycerate dehydrogenase family protein [Pseudomonadota bacterium]